MDSAQSALASYSATDIKDMNYMVQRVQIAQIFFAVWLGALSLDLLYYVVFDFELVFFTSGWRVPARCITRLSYMLSRLSGATALLLCLFFLSLDWSEAQCRMLPYVFQSLLLLSYICTLLILYFRTLALYSSNSKLDRTVQWGLGLGLVNIATWTLVHLRSAKGVRAEFTESRCDYHEAKGGPLLVKGLLVSTVLLNLAMFSLTFYKMYISGTHNFFNGRTFLTRWIIRKEKSRQHEHLSANHLASSLITQGLYAFFVLLLVDIVALLSSFLLGSTFQLMAIVSLGSFSSVLGSMVFRETLRASESIASLAKVELELAQAQAEKAAEKKKPDRQQGPGKTSRSHYRFNPDLDTGSQPHLVSESFDGHSDSTRTSFDSRHCIERPITMISVFEDDSRPPSVNGMAIDEASPSASFNQTSLGMLSLHAFDGGVTSNPNGGEKVDTLGQVSILGGSWVPSVSNRTSKGFKRNNIQDGPSKSAGTKVVSTLSASDEQMEIAAEREHEQSLPPPVRRKRKGGHSHYSSRIQSLNSSQESFASVSTNPPSFSSESTLNTANQKEEMKNAPAFI